MQACVNEVSDGCLAKSNETFEKISRVLVRNRTYDDAMEVVNSIPSWNSETRFHSFFTQCQATII